MVKYYYANLTEGFHCITELAMPQTSRDEIVTFRVYPRERRELDLLARAEGASRSELLRDLIAERVENLTGADDNRQDPDDD